MECGRAARAERERADREPSTHIKRMHTDSDGAYGRPRITAELDAAGRAVNHKRVARLMRRLGVAEPHLRERIRTTVPEPAATPMPGRLFDRRALRCIREVRSRGAVGTSADNAAAEAFNATLKRETPQGVGRRPGALAT